VNIHVLREAGALGESSAALGARVQAPRRRVCCCAAAVSRGVARQLAGPAEPPAARRALVWLLAGVNARVRRQVAPALPAPAARRARVLGRMNIHVLREARTARELSVALIARVLRLVSE